MLKQHIMRLLFMRDKTGILQKSLGNSFSTDG